MTNTSATGGYLSPGSGAPVEDDALEDLFCDVISGISGISRVNVRPRWQAKPPPFPKDEVTWCAAGIMGSTADYSASTTHIGDGDGAEQVVRHDTVSVMASFYGPHANSRATLVRDGLSLSQNRDSLRAVGIAVRECTTMRTASDLLNERWVRRVDLDISLRRAITRVYPILNLLSAQGEFRTSGGYVQNFVTET